MESIYYPINYFSLAQALSNYVGPHELKKLTRVSNKLNVVFKGMTFTNEQKMVNAIKYDCYRCYNKFSLYLTVEQQALCICKSGNASYITRINIPLNVDMICAIAELSNKSQMMTKYISLNHISLQNCIDIIKHCCNPSILKVLCKPSNISICLTKLCEYNMSTTIESYINYIQDVNLLHQCLFISDNHSIKSILASSIMDLGESCPFTIDWVKNYGNQKLIKNHFEHQDDFMETYYRVDLERCVQIKTIEEELQSIVFAEKYNRNYMSIDNLTNEQKINALKNVTDARFKMILLALDDGTTVDDVLLCKHKKVIKPYGIHIAKLNVEYETKRLFYKYIYKYHSSYNAQEIFEENKELNLLSVNYANKYSGRLYINWLDMYDIIALLSKYKDNNTITKVLTQQLKISMIKEHMPLEPYEYHYVETRYDDDDVERSVYYKLVLDENTIMTKENYHQLAYQFYLEIEALYKKDHVDFDQKVPIMLKFIKHPQFIYLDDGLVVMFIKMYANVLNIRQKLLEHPLFC